ncbi:MAG: GYD domain-containing protein [Armatimonadota bacterium]|nr:GYD domain-containing protein [bacterium]MDW8322008.1 GYD domain-containing protein [Armatimonadota bacterium]
MQFVTLAKAVPGRAKELFSSGLPQLNSLASQHGIHVTAAVITYGQYDLVAVWSAPDQATANRFLRAVAETGLLVTDTMLAVPAESF